MKTKHKFILFFSLLVLVALGILAYSYFYPKSQKFIKEEIKKANYCQKNEDCTYIMTNCPFDCYAFVNKNEATYIEKLTKSYRSRCAYGCVSIAGVGCMNNKCKPIFQD